MEVKGCDEFREWLVEHGFKVFEDCLKSEFNLCNWYACRYTDLQHRRCETNTDKRMQLVVKPYHWKDKNNDYKGVEVELRGESKGIWFSLKAYAMPQDELMQRLPEIESALVNAWNALAQVEE